MIADGKSTLTPPSRSRACAGEAQRSQVVDDTACVVSILVTVALVLCCVHARRVHEPCLYVVAGEYYLVELVDAYALGADSEPSISKVVYYPDRIVRLTFPAHISKSTSCRQSCTLLNII